MNGVVASCQGILPRDAELRYTPGGQAVLNFSVAVHDEKRVADAPTEWLKVAAWGELAEELDAAGVLEKGAEVHVEGRIRLNTWAGQDGQPRAGLSMNAWRVDPIGGAGRRRRPTPAGQAAGDAPVVDLAHAPAYRQRIAAAAAEGTARAASRPRWGR